jgi:hypothetical protein
MVYQPRSISFMRKGILPLLGLVAFTIMALTPATSFAATSARTAKTPSVHLFPSRNVTPLLGSSSSSTHAAAALSVGANAAVNASANAASANASAASPVLPYQGGPVMAGTTNIYAIFWQPNGNVSTNYDTLISRYFGDVGGSPLYQNLKQYTQTGGAFPSNAVLAASWVDNTTPYSANPILDSDIQTEVTHAQTVNNWTSTGNNIFFVFTEKNEGLCTDSNRSSCTPDITPTTGFCAYHSSFGTNTIYAAVPYAASPSFGGGCTPGAPSNLNEPSAPATGSYPNNDDADLTINLTSHEEMEAATDPFGNGWITNLITNQYFEIGDLCVWTFSPNNAQGADVVWNGHNYIVQQEWDNSINACDLSGDHAAKYYTIQNLNSHEILDILSASTAQGASLVQWGNHLGMSQQWDLVPTGSLYEIVNRHSGLVLDDYHSGNTDGTPVVQWANHDGLSQLWYLVPDGVNDQIVNFNSNRVLDVYHSGVTNGTPVVQWNSHNGASQQWSFNAVKPYYAIQNPNSGLVLDVSQGSSASGASTVQWPYQGHGSQQWALLADGTRNGSPIYQLENLNSGLVLDDYHSQTTNGTPVIQWTNHNGIGQQWFLIADGTHNGVPIYLIKNANSGLVLDVYHSQKTAGAAVIQWTNHNGASQQWSILTTSA